MTETSPPAQPRLNRRFRLQYESVQSAWVLLYPEGMVKLNDSAAEILKRCDGHTTVDELVASLEQAFSVQGIGDQVRALLTEGTHRGWIE
jgi:pyrroloquinoline quinone biosynthesis protein D